MSTSEFDDFLPTAEFDPSTIPTAALHDFRFLIRDRICPVAHRLGEWLDEWVVTELDRRLDGREPDLDPRHSLPPLLRWTVGDIGRGLWASVVLSYTAMDDSLSRFTDRLVFALADASKLCLEKWDIDHGQHN
jgi:hypothetical protein